MTPLRHHSPNTGPAAFEELVATLQERLPTMSESQRRLSQRVMADPEGVAFMTVTELAQAVEVNESTVVRFASSLGLKGYPALARLCQERLREQAQLLRRFQGAAALTSQAEDALQLTTTFDQANLTRTFSRIDPEAWAAAVTSLAEARRVHVLGMRKCFAVSYLFGYLLGMVRDDVDILTNNGGNLVDELRRVDADDCFVAVSIHRYSADTVRAFRWANSKGATTLALTDNPGSPLASGADHTFFADTTGIAILRSLTSFTALVQALANAVAEQLGPDARQTLTDEEELLDHFLVYDPEQLGGRW